MTLGPDQQKIGLAVTGASGFIYGWRLLQELTAHGALVHVTISPNAKHIAAIEHGIDVDLETGKISGIPSQAYENICYHHYSHVGAAPASGSYPLNAVAVVPCSMGTMGRIATGTSEDLIGRMAEVALKERRPLVLVPRETPYNTIQLKNMYELSQTGAVILPASPGLYHRPQSIQDMVDFIISRILQHLGFDGSKLIQGGWGALHPGAQSVFLSKDESLV